MAGKKLRALRDAAAAERRPSRASIWRLAEVKRAGRGRFYRVNQTRRKSPPSTPGFRDKQHTPRLSRWAGMRGVGASIRKTTDEFGDGPQPEVLEEGFSGSGAGVGAAFEVVFEGAGGGEGGCGEDDEGGEEDVAGEGGEQARAGEVLRRRLKKHDAAARCSGRARRGRGGWLRRLGTDRQSEVLEEGFSGFGAGVGAAFEVVFEGAGGGEGGGPVRVTKEARKTLRVREASRRGRGSSSLQAQSRTPRAK